jgi:hypothetical protein
MHGVGTLIKVSLLIIRELQALGGMRGTETTVRKQRKFASVIIT